MKQLCIRCNGTGFYMGNGFMKTECELCNDDEKLPYETPTLETINRKSKSYQKAIKDIMAVNPDISRSDAIKMFDEAYLKD